MLDVLLKTANPYHETEKDFYNDEAKSFMGVGRY